MHIKVWSGRIQYEFNITEKYTILKGDSGTGKTTLSDLVSRQGKGSTISSKLEFVILPDRRYNDILNEKDLIILIDEDHPILEINNRNQLTSLLKRSDNYFLIIYRMPIVGLPVSIESMYKIKTSGTYHTFVPLYDEKAINLPCHIDSILCEDEKSSKIFLEKYFSCPCVTSKGKDTIAKMLNNNETDDLLVFYDSLSAGYLEEDIIIEKNKRVKNTYLFHPKCFEKYILESRMIKYEFNDSNRNYTEDEYKDIISKVLPIKYDKSRLSVCILNECNTFGHEKCKGCSLYVPIGKKREYLMHSGLELFKEKNKVV